MIRPFVLLPLAFLVSHSLNPSRVHLGKVIIGFDPAHPAGAVDLALGQPANLCSSRGSCSYILIPVNSAQDVHFPPVGAVPLKTSPVSSSCHFNHSRHFGRPAGQRRITLDPHPQEERHFVQYFQCHFSLTLPGRHSTIYGPKSPYMVCLCSRILLRCCHADKGRTHHDNQGVRSESHH